MAEIYRVSINVQACQWALPCDESFTSRRGLVFDGTSRMAAWDPPKFYISNSLKPRSPFFIISAGAFAFDETVMVHPYLSMHLEKGGEFLPIELETGERLFILNVTTIANALDHDLTEYRRDPLTQSIMNIERYAFHPNRLGETGLFKIPETCRAEILTSSRGRPDAEEDFITAYEESGLAGLKFEELWSTPSS